MTTPATMDVFITHAWRYHEDWNRLVAFLDSWKGLMYRNFSLPWHDPALDANVEPGKTEIRVSLERQIIPARVVIALSSVYKMGSARKWVSLELDYADKHGKPILALPDFESSEIPEDLKARATAVSRWDPKELAAAIEGFVTDATAPAARAG